VAVKTHDLGYDPVSGQAVTFPGDVMNHPKTARSQSTLVEDLDINSAHTLSEFTCINRQVTQFRKNYSGGKVVLI
jgi:hypothetical protein